MQTTLHKDCRPNRTNDKIDISASRPTTSININSMSGSITRPTNSVDDNEFNDELFNMDRPTNKSEERIDWSQFKDGWKEKIEPEIFLEQECGETVFSLFRQLSYKVTGCCYDIPQGHRVILAYAKMQGSSDPAQAVGVITYWVASKDSSPKSNCFMDDSFHKVSFLFVDKCYQKKGIGRRLVNEAIEYIRRSTIKQAIHLEGAKSAIKFFRKMGFISCSKLTRSISRRHSIFNNCVNMYYKL